MTPRTPPKEAASNGVDARSQARVAVHEIRICGGNAAPRGGQTGGAKHRRRRRWGLRGMRARSQFDATLLETVDGREVESGRRVPRRGRDHLTGSGREVKRQSRAFVDHGVKVRQGSRRVREPASLPGAGSVTMHHSTCSGNMVWDRPSQSICAMAGGRSIDVQGETSRQSKRMQAGTDEAKSNMERPATSSETRSITCD